MLLSFSSAIRTRALFCGVAATLCASAGAAATLHRNVITQSTGSEGATATLQTNPSDSALQGEVANSVNTSIRIPFGVLGEYDAGKSIFGIGVAGLSTSGYGVAAESFGNNPSLIAESGANNDAFDAIVPSGSSGTAVLASATGYSPTIIADASNAVAVYAKSSGQPAINAQSMFGVGVEGSSQSGNGVTGTTATSNGVIGAATSTATSGSNSGITSVGVVASAQVGTGAIVENDSIYAPALSISNTAGSSAAVLIEAGLENNTPKFSVDGEGDLYAAGAITSGTNTVNAVSRNPGSTMLTYAPQQAEASMEDVGTARLIDGSATVPLAADFRQTINANVPYAVFLTPYGESHGLYVAARTPGGFVVREAQGGRSNVSFDYRIVAKPYGSQIVRLPHVVLPKTLSARVAASLRTRIAENSDGLRRQAAASVARARTNAEALRTIRR